MGNICHSETPDKESFSRVAKFHKIDGEILEAEPKLYASFRRMLGLGCMTVPEMLETMHDNDLTTNINSGHVTTATIPYIRGTSETITRILQPDNIRVAHKPITTLRRLLTNVKDKDKPEDRQGAVYKIKCCDCQASYIGETGRNLSTRLTEHKRATRNGDVNNHIAEHHLKTKHQIDWDSATCITYSTDYYQRLTLKSWFTNLEQTPLNRSQQLPAPYKRLIDEIKQN